MEGFDALNYKVFGLLTDHLAIDLTKSLYKFPNKSDFKIIPAYYYGEAVIGEHENRSYTHLYDYKYSSVNVEP
jgi:hypothetical protein